MRVMFAVFYSSTETVYYTQVEKLLGATHFTVSAICSPAYIPQSVFLLNGTHCTDHADHVIKAAIH
jgi:hypothetical protein